MFKASVDLTQLLWLYALLLHTPLDFHPEASVHPEHTDFTKVFIPLAYWPDSVDCEWWLYKSHYPSMKLISIDMELSSVLLVGKVIGGFKTGVCDIALISHVNNNEFNEMSLFDVSRFAFEKETYLITI